MIERGQNFRFALETRHTLSVAGEDFRLDLDGHNTIEPCVPSAVNLAHPTCTDSWEDFIGAQAECRTGWP